MLKLSKYNTKCKLDQNKNMLYNTLTRKYVVFNNSLDLELNKLCDNLDRKEFEVNEFSVIKSLISKGIIIDEKINESEKIKNIYDSSKFQQEVYYLTLQPTLDCNFRCVYCYEEHKKLKFNEDVKNRILKFVDKVSKKHKKVQVAWFGGEPLLEKDTILDLTTKFKEICHLNNCEYMACITTNAYLFDDELIDNIDNLCIKSVQITLDGAEEYHNKMRPLTNGEPTFQKIKENLIKLAEKDVTVNLRVNINKENYDSVLELLYEIPIQLRDKVVIYIYNIFQEENKLNTFDLYKQAIELGYRYSIFRSGFSHCEAGFQSSLTVDPEGNISPCSMAAENKYKYGFINNEGDIIIENTDLYYNFKNLSLLDTENCNKCTKFPVCFGGCKYAKYLDNSRCDCNGGYGMTMNQKLLLQYINDVKLNKKIEELVL